MTSIKLGLETVTKLRQLQESYSEERARPSLAPVVTISAPASYSLPTFLFFWLIPSRGRTLEIKKKVATSSLTY